ncbi:potassium efflux system protein [Salinibacillus kushneri]|uniref:Potassium efflux system protein n=1 Tax=Salinibacillus kushneri TaxID=237682 RepID=A0A1I0A890_9BACI|nr:potassium efflux system protein [Salinibacillus kushneri]
MFFLSSTIYNLFLSNSVWISEVIVYAVVLCLIFLLRWIVNVAIRKFNNHEALRSIVNWVTIYGALVYTLLYFLDADWMTREITSVGKVEISFFLVIVAILIISFAHRASKVMTKYLLPRAYSRYQ